MQMNKGPADFPPGPDYRSANWRLAIPTLPIDALYFTKGGSATTWNACGRPTGVIVSPTCLLSVAV